MTTNTTNQEFFEAKYRENNDPWAFASNAYKPPDIPRSSTHWILVGMGARSNRVAPLEY